MVTHLGLVSKTHSPRVTHTVDGENGTERLVEYQEARSTVYSNLTALGSATSNPSSTKDGIGALYLKKIDVQEGDGELCTVTEVYGTGDAVGGLFAGAGGSAIWYELDIGVEEAPLLENNYYASISETDLRLLKQLITSGPYAKDNSGNYVAGQVTSTGAPAHALNQIMRGRLTYPRPRAIFRVVNEDAVFPTSVSGIGQSSNPPTGVTIPQGFEWIYIGDTATRQGGRVKRTTVYQLQEISSDLI